jgi:dolichol-phosphate mannosyltransferase
LYDKCSQGNEITFAYRKNIKANLFGKIFSKTYAFFIKKLISSEYPNNGFDVVMFNDKIKNILNQNIESNSSIFLQILTLGFKKTIIYYDKNNRKLGKSKWTVSKKIKLLIDSFVSFSYFPIRLVSVVGIIFFIIGLVWTSLIVVRTLLFQNMTRGWPTLISVLMIGFGITNISLGIIAEYLWRTLDVSRKRPAFIVDEIINL